MATLTHEQCGLVLLHDCADEAHHVLLNATTEERAVVPANAQLAFSKKGWGYLKIGGDENTWCSKLHPHRVAGAQGDQIYAHDSLANETWWQHKRRREHSSKYFCFDLLVEGRKLEVPVKLMTFSLHRCGCYLHVQIRDIQDCGLPNCT